jgi:hypothetical protein
LFNIAEIFVKQDNFFAKHGTGIGMKICEGKDSLIEHNITRNIDTPCRYLKTFDSFVSRTISKKNAPLGAKSKFSLIVRPKTWPIRTTKNTKRLIIWFSAIKTLKRCIIVDDFARKHVDKICGCKKGFIPKF